MTEAARFFQALGDETRLTLLDLLRDGEKTVGELVDALGCPQPKVSRHLKVLKEAGLVADHKAGRHVHYGLATIARWGKEPREWIDRLDAGLQPRTMVAPRPGPRPPREPSAPRRPTHSTEWIRPDDLETYLL